MMHSNLKISTILTAVLTMGAMAVFFISFLLAETEISLLITVALGIGFFIFAKNQSYFENMIIFSNQRPVFFHGLIIIIISLILSICKHEHFALFMIASVTLYATACFGLTLQLGYAGLTNFAGAAFLGIGGYTVAILANNNVPIILSVLFGGITASLIGSLLILPILRTRGHYAALVTIAFSLLFKTFLELNEFLGGPQGIKIPPMNLFGWSFSEPVLGGSFYISYVILSLIVMGVVLGITRLVEKSWLGLHFDSVRIDEVASSCFGINIAFWKITAFTIGNFFIGISGGIYANMLGHIAPTNFTFGDSLILISIVILGGIGNPIGVLPAAFLILVLPEKLQFIQEYRLLLFSILVILVLIYRPDGLLNRPLRKFYKEWGPPFIGK